MKTRSLVCVLLLAMLVPSVYSQTPGEPLLEDAEPYDPQEFSQFARDLRRAEIVAVGTVPLTLFVSRFLYGIGRFAVQSFASGAVAPEYLPPIFAPPGSVPLSRRDNAWILAGTATLSGGIALLDYFLGRAEDSGD
jgi:hypothetical protein